jgi:hypothetical protein
MLNNFLYNIIFFICISISLNILLYLIYLIIKRHSLYQLIYFSNVYGFINDILLKYLLEYFLEYLSDNYYPNSYKITFIFYQINPKTKLFVPISEECIFDFNIKNRISVDELYNLIKWNEDAFIPSNDIMLLYKTIK